MLCSHFACIIFFGSSLIPRAYSQVQPLPSAETILDRFVVVSGGQAAYNRVQNEVTKETLRVSGTTVAETLTYRTKTGNFRQIARGADGQSEIGVNNGVVWRRTGETAQILESGEERAQVLQTAELLSDGHWRQFYKSAVTVGAETVEGKPCYTLKVVPFVGEPHTLWYDQKTGLQVREVMPILGGGDGAMTAEEYFDAGGIKMARVLHSQINGVTLTTVVEDVKFDQPIPDSTFALPPDIERLIKKWFAVK
jgi:outer membrane lipoprotein-sorting protein